MHAFICRFLRALCGAGLGAAIAITFSPFAQAAYDWRTVRIGGGGAATSIKAHPQVPNLFFMTTDVGNPYRWNDSAQRWEGLLNHVPPSAWNQTACATLAIDPTDATGNILYATVGKYAPYIAGYEWIDSYGPGKVIKSTDRGTTWSDTGLFVDVSANRHQTSGERIAVDPQNGAVVYVTSHADGTYRSADGGSTWTQISPLNGQFIAVDVSGGLVGGISRNIFIGNNDGVYGSTDGGDTFTLLAGSPTSARRAAIHANGTLYVTSYSAGVHKWSGGTWTNVSPATGAFIAVDVNPANSSQVVVSSHAWGATSHYRSNDGGATWTKFSRSPDFTEVPFSAGDRFCLSTFDFCWDPFNANRVWFTDWFNAYETTDIWANPVIYKARAVGHEEIVTIGMLACPPSGPNALLSGTADLGGFDHPSIASPPEISMADHFPWVSSTALNGNMSGAAFQETNPYFLVRVGRRGWDGAGIGGYSTNGGLSYTQWTLPAGLAGGKVAVAASSETIVWVPQSGSTHRSVDRGLTWTPVTGVPSSVIGGNNVFWGAAMCPIAADKVNGSKFYIYYNGAMYISTDAGVSFSLGATGLPVVSNTSFLKVETTPGLEGDIWLSLGSSGLFHSTNSGASFAQIPNVQKAPLMAVGKGLSATPSVYVMGQVNMIADGIFRSDDGGGTWTQIDSATHKMGDEPNAMAADRNVHGRVFVGTNGNGIFVGDIVIGSPPAAPTGIGATAGDGQVALSWNGSAGATGYNVKRSSAAGGGYTTIAAGISQTLHIDSGLTNGSTYYYVVSAVNTAGESANSAEVAATPLGGTSQVIAAAADGYVQDGTYANTNYGTVTPLLVKQDVSPWNRQAFFKFPLGGLGGQITSAVLRLHGQHNSGTALPPIDVYGVPSDAWTESGLTWNTKPVLGALLDTVAVGATEQYYEWDVTGFAQAQVAAGATSLSLAALMGALPSDGQYDWFNSREATANPPQLVITISENTFSLSEDAYVQNGTYADTNYGTATTLIVKRDVEPWERQALLKFQVSGLTGPVTGATLRLYGQHNSGTSPTAVSVHGIGSNAWTETGVTWNTKPAFGALLDTTTVSTTPQYYDWDVTSFVQAQLAAGSTTFSFGATMDAVPGDGQYNWFYSREAGSQVPQLVLTVTANTFVATADAHVQNGTYADTNYGGASTLIVKNDVAPWARQSFLKFELGSTSGAVSSAVLRLYGQHNSGTSTPPVSVHGVSTNSWTESGVTWNTKPALGTLLDTVNPSTTPQYYEWDVTSFVQAQLNGGISTLSFGLLMDTIPADGQYDWFNSREAGAEPPQLVIMP